MCVVSIVSSDCCGIRLIAGCVTETLSVWCLLFPGLVTRILGPLFLLLLVPKHLLLAAFPFKKANHTGQTQHFESGLHSTHTNSDQDRPLCTYRMITMTKGRCATPTKRLSPCQQASRRVRRNYLKQIRNREYQRLRAIVPAIANKKKVSKVTNLPLPLFCTFKPVVCV